MMLKRTERLRTPNGILFILHGADGFRNRHMVLSEDYLDQMVGRPWRDKQPKVDNALMLTGMSGNTRYVKEAVEDDNNYPSYDDAEDDFVFRLFLNDIVREKEEARLKEQKEET